MPTTLHPAPNEAQYNRLRQEGCTNLSFNPATGGISGAHPQAHKKELCENLTLCKFLASALGDVALVRQHSEQSGANPELDINGQIADRKTPDPCKYKSVSSPIKNKAQRAQRQGARHCCFELWSKYSQPEIEKGVASAFRLTTEIDTIDIIFRHQTIARITRKDFEDGSFRKKLSNRYIEPQK